MKDLSLHLLDLIENSANAGAEQVVLSFDWNETVLSITLTDNGPGLPDTIKNDPTNPFTTTRTTRSVGFGLNFFREAAEQTGGQLEISSATDGIFLKGSFYMDHIDAKPLGDITETILAVITAWTKLDIELNVSGKNILSLVQLRTELGDIELTQPQVREYLYAILAAGLLPLKKWLAKISPSFS